MLPRIIVIIALVAFGGWKVAFPLLCAALTVIPFIAFATYAINQQRRSLEKQ